MTPRSERTSAFEASIEQKWSEYYFQFMTNYDGLLFYVSPVNISANINISIQTILNHPEYEWNLEGLSKNPNLTWDFVKTYKDGVMLRDDELLWDYRLHSRHYVDDYENNEDMREIANPPMSDTKTPDYTIDEIIAISSKGTPSIANLLRSKRLFPQDLLDHPEVEWPYRRFACINPNMTISYFKKFLELGYIKNRGPNSLATFNSAFNFEDIIKTPELGWDFNEVGINNTLRFQFILDNRKINGKEYLDYVDENEFVVEKAAFLERKQREYLAAYRVQQWWWRVTSNPANLVCQHRLEREYADMFSNVEN